MTSNLYTDLKQQILNIALCDGVYDIGISDLKICKRSKTSNLKKCFYDAMILFMVQGEKQTVVNHNKFQYHEGQCIVTGVAMPSLSAVTRADSNHPMLCIGLDFNDSLMLEVLNSIENHYFDNSLPSDIFVIDASETLADAFLRLLKLRNEDPFSRNFLSQNIIKEIYFRIIISPLGNFLKHFYKEGTPSNQIAKAIKFLKDHFKEEININDLSDKIHMSPSAFFRNFSKVTGTTPLQYQKQLRLYEAQRILLQQDINTQKAAFLVGYKSANQFCRDYKKLFGNPPKTNIKLLST